MTAGVSSPETYSVPKGFEPFTRRRKEQRRHRCRASCHITRTATTGSNPRGGVQVARLSLSTDTEYVHIGRAARDCEPDDAAAVVR